MFEGAFLSALECSFYSPRACSSSSNQWMMQVLWIARSNTSRLPNQRKMIVPLDPCSITSLNSQWNAKMMWRCFQCQLPRMTGTSCIKSGEFVTAPSETAKLVDIGIFDLNMFRKFLKNSNSMFDVALSM